MSWEQRPYADPNFGRGNGGFSDNPLNWAPRLFTMDGIRVRLHILFILYILYSLLESLGAATKWNISAGEAVSYTARYLMVIFGSIFLHELGHHHDRMTTRSRRGTARGEAYAENYALAYADRIWDGYVDAFGLV